MSIQAIINTVAMEYLLIMGFSSHANNRANDVYVLGKDFIQGMNGARIYADKINKTDFTQQDKTFVLSLHYNCYLFVDGLKKLKCKTKNSEIARNFLCLRNISIDFSTTNATKTGLYGNVYDFTVDYVPINGVRK